MSLRDRIGIDVGRRLRLEEALEWAAEHEVRWIDISIADVLTRIADHPARRITELLPWHWQPADLSHAAA